MTFTEIKDLLIANFGEEPFEGEDKGELQPQLTVDKEFILKVCEELYKNEATYFDFLSSITGIDNGPDKGTMEVVYNLYSIPYNHQMVLKVVLSRGEDNELPKIPSVVPIWKGANWQEREIYDMLGIVFEGHPDLRRILLPEDWEGYPLRKDYKTQDYYHGIKVAY